MAQPKVSEPTRSDKLDMMGDIVREGADKLQNQVHAFDNARKWSNDDTEADVRQAFRAARQTHDSLGEALETYESILDTPRPVEVIIDPPDSDPF